MIFFYRFIKNKLFLTASASASFNFNFEELIAKLFEAFQQNKENNKDDNADEEINKKEEKNKVEDNVQSEGILLNFKIANKLIKIINIKDIPTFF